MDNAPGFFDQGGAYIKDLLEMALEALEEGLLFSTEQVPIVILFAFLGLCSAVFVIAWQRNSQMKHWLIGGAFAMLPLATFAILLSLESMRGGPDDRCHKYDQGKLPLNVIGIYKTRQDQRDIFSGEWVLLVVRSVRWGNDPHLCRVNIETAAGGVLLDLFFPKNKKGEREFIDVFGDGEVTFTFGGRIEKPNATFKPNEKRDRKQSPPEPSMERTF